ncbi:iron uptake porin [Alkalinema sp. FACHB-956]|uniref:iron uptake porin n=1 Tax=Alkalinema sp. FACHB-956 TaxID=2692768 RepID=UPI001687DB9B|nr:iron uptake porin [Alkalinema sp. FACHB-956]
MESLPAIAQPHQTRTEQIMAETSLEPIDHPVEPFLLVSQLSDVRSTDWAYQALQSLVERHGVIVGYPNGTFRGSRSMPRYEFAAGMNAAFDRMNADMQEEFAKYATQEELEVVRKMQEEFARELAAVKSGQFGSDERLIQTIGRSFSLTSKLNGEAIFQTSFVGGQKRADDNDRGLDRQLTLSQRSKLEITTSFTGKDLLTTSLKASNLPNLARASGTDMMRLGVQGDSNNQLEADEISYRFRIGKPMTARLIAAGGSLTDFAQPLNPFLDDTGDGAISRFAQRNPILRQGNGAGAGLSYKFSDQVRLGIGYIGDDLNDPRVGFRNAGYGAIAQLTVSPSDSFDIGFAYVRSYNTLRTGTGSRRANDPFAGRSNAIVGNSFGVQTALAMSPSVHLSGWLGWTQAYASDLNNDPKADIFNWAVTLAFPDVGGTGNLLGFAIGQPPKVTSNEFSHRGQANTDRDTSLHFEGFYRWRVNDNLALTAGLLIVTNPEHDQGNSTLYSGVLRSTFSF